MEQLYDGIVLSAALFYSMYVSSLLCSYICHMSTVYCRSSLTLMFDIIIKPFSSQEMNKNWSGVNRNALINADGSTPFICSPVAPMNIMVNDSFDKDLVPGPKHGSLPLAMIAKFLPLLLGLVGEGMNVKELIPEDISTVESVPITWACTTNPLRSILLRVHHIIRD